jgi:hypothetical protein
LNVRRFLSALALVAGVIASAISVPAVAATATPRAAVTGIGVQLVDIPTAALNDPRAHSYIVDRLAPGRTIDRRIQVTNGTRTRATVSLYAAAANIVGGQFLGASGRTQNELSTWTSVTPGRPVLAPGKKTFVHVKVQVPADAAPGERYGVVWAQLATPPSNKGGVTQVGRVGIRLYLSIGPGGAPASDFKILSLTGARDDKGLPSVLALTKNTGGRALDLNGDLRLSHGPGELAAGPFPVTLGTTLGIGQTESVAVSLDARVPDGPWLATITMKSGLTKRTAEATLTFPSGVGVGTTALAADSAHPTWWAIAISAVAPALLLALVWYVRGTVANMNRPSSGRSCRTAKG